MDFNKIAINSISSEYIKRYLTRIGHKFSLEEQITLVFNSKNTFSEKMKLYNDLLCIKEIKDNEEIKEKLNSIVHNMYMINEALNGVLPNFVILYTDEHGSRACSDIEILKRNIDNKSGGTIAVDICNIATFKVDASVYLNDNYEPVRYYITEKSGLSKSGLEDMYVNIPNDIHVGDIVKAHGDITDTEYVVIGNSDIPKEMIDDCCYEIDVALSIVPKNLLPKDDRTYKEIIESIIKNRIYYLEDTKYTDVIASYEEHIHLTLVEKVDI